MLHKLLSQLYRTGTKIDYSNIYKSANYFAPYFKCNYPVEGFYITFSIFFFLLKAPRLA